MAGLTKILVALDGSEGANKALAVSIDLAKRSGAELHSISVEEDLPHYTIGMVKGLRTEREESRYFQRITVEAQENAQRKAVSLHPHILAGHEVRTIVRFVRDHQIDLLVIGFTGHSNLVNSIWGSTSQSLTQQTPCQVLVVK